MKNCLKCKNPEYTWYEVLRDNCGNGKNIKEVFDDCLCSKHYVELREQVLKRMKQK